MQIEFKKTDELTPYEHNARNNDSGVGVVAQSIKQFGFKVPIVIDSNGVIIAGHTRLKAAKLLGMDTVPVIVADDLTEEQVKAFRLADNKVAEFSTWDFGELDKELSQIWDIDMSDFGFDLEDVSDEALTDAVEKDLQRELTVDKVVSILNTDIAIFPGDGPFDIPMLDKVTDIPDIDEWTSFNYAKSDTSPENKGLHFFLHDYQFERVWNRPLDYIDVVSKYPLICAPDFSPMGGLPMATQIWNHYRKMWCARLWQTHGALVIPTITWSTDEASLDWFLDGVPEGSIVCTSMMWNETDEQRAITKAGWDRLIQTVKPPLVFTYGKPLDFMTETETREMNMFQSRFDRKD